MTISEQNIGLWAERFLNHELNSEELKVLNIALSANPDLESMWNETIELVRLLEESREQKIVKAKIKSVIEKRAKMQDKQTSVLKMSFSRYQKYWKVVAFAAALVLVSSFFTFWIVNSRTDQTGTQYQLLRREIETIKHSQSQLLDSIKFKNNPKATSDLSNLGPVFVGTGFALTNDGFVATNYHVVKDAHSIYVQTKEGVELKAYVYAFEPTSDVAILKIEDQDFQFGKVPLPYTFEKSTSGLGQQVFSIGYPQEHLVYNEGYVSCETGFDGDSASYQLEMISNPGQSGAPVLNKQGNIVALITGKQSNTSGKTYAVHSGALLQLISTLPKETKINLPEHSQLRNLSRTRQVEVLRNYVCAVKVNY